MRKFYSYSGILLLAVLLNGNNLFSQTLVYSQTFYAGSSSEPQCDAWVAFCNSINLSNTYASITISGSGSATATGAVAQAIATALKNNTTYAGASGGYNWAVDNWGGCNAGGTAGPELTATGALCSCNSGYTVRPCIHNANWGSANGGATCGGGTQTMTVTLTVAGPPCSWSGSSGSSYPTIVCGSFTSVPAGSGTYTYFTAVAGATYTVSTCGSSFDTDLTIYDANPAWTARAWNQDNGPDCAGTNASVQWTATYSGDHIAVVNRVGCQQHDWTGTSAILKFRKDDPCACTPNQPATTWTGAVNSNWNNGNNWTNCVPGPNTNTTIPVVGSGVYPVLNGGAHQVNTITVNPGASCTVNAPATLTATQ